MLQTLGLVVHLVPFHAENLGEHALDQVMAKSELARDLAARCSQADVAVSLHANQAVSFQAPQCHGDGRGRNRKPVGQRGGDDALAFAFSFQDRLQIVFFGDGNHLERLYGEG